MKKSIHTQVRIKKTKQDKRTSDQASSLTRYLREIGQTPLLTPVEEQELATRIQKGDDDARQHMLLANLRLVVNIAKQYVPSNDPDLLMDLIQEGNIGLMRAVDRFKPEFRTRFSTYGVYWIRQAVLRALKSRRLVRLPENVVDRVLEMQRTRQRLYQALGRTPTPEELAAEMKATPREINRLEVASSDIISLERSVRGKEEEEETRLQDLLEDVDSPAPSDLAQTSLVRSEIKIAVSTLPDRERAIINARFGLTDNKPRTLEEIGEKFGISRERVRQLQNVALDRLRARQGVQHAR
ncbi:MAG: RNA polymerase sigma factor RpoD/SigA [Candidatus Andersenbacteria bacterium]